jgi:hypothetical protein
MTTSVINFVNNYMTILYAARSMGYEGFRYEPSSAFVHTLEDYTVVNDAVRTYPRLQKRSPHIISSAKWIMKLDDFADQVW